MSLTKVTSGAVTGLATSATTDTTDASNITTGTIPTARLDTGTSANKLVQLDSTGKLPAISGANLTDIDAATVSATAPSSPAQGDMWFNTSTSLVDGISSKCMASYSGTEWLQMSNKFSATGGTESSYSSGGTNYKVHTFTSSGTFTAEAAGSVDVLVVAGGGGGGTENGGGGGAGGMIVQSSQAVVPQSYSVTVGAGAAAAQAEWIPGFSGSNSSVMGLTSIGGGGGGSNNVSANFASVGGSGGGAGEAQNRFTAGTSGQGNQGGSSLTFTLGGGAGGGGAGAAGQSVVSNTQPGDGGIGKTNDFRTGSNIYYAGGGGGGEVQTGDGNFGNIGTGGLGGGADGSQYKASSYSTSGPDHNAQGFLDINKGAVNTGGGGGGGGQAGFGPNGGSGIVVIRYAV